MDHLISHSPASTTSTCSRDHYHAASPWTCSMMPHATVAIGAPDLLCAPDRLVRELLLCILAHDTSDRLLSTSQPPDLDAHRLRTRTASKQQPCLPSTAHVMNHVVRRLRPSQRMRMAASLTPRGPLLMNGSQTTDLHAVAAAAAGLGQQPRVAPR